MTNGNVRNLIFDANNRRPWAPTSLLVLSALAQRARKTPACWLVALVCLWCAASRVLHRCGLVVWGVAPC